jgi:hypothetical protein
MGVTGMMGEALGRTAILLAAATVAVGWTISSSSTVTPPADRAALRQPSERPTPGMICPAQLVIVPLLFLIDGQGHIVRPVIPTDGCL